MTMKVDIVFDARVDIKKAREFLAELGQQGLDVQIVGVSRRDTARPGADTTHARRWAGGLAANSDSGDFQIGRPGNRIRSGAGYTDDRGSDRRFNHPKRSAQKGRPAQGLRLGLGNLEAGYPLT